MRRAFGPIVAFLALLATGCHRAPPIEARPAMWRVSDGDTTIWLLGTIHVLPDNVHWQTPAIRNAIESADALVMEIPDDPGVTQRAFTANSSGHTLPPVAARIAPARRAALAAALAAGGLSNADVDGKKSWAAAFIIAGATNAARGITRKNGPEAILSAAFAARHRPSGGLEDPVDQFGAFDSLSEGAQRVLLESAIDSAAGGGADYQATLAAWAAGDEGRIAATIDPEFRAAPEIEALIVKARNNAWAGKIAARMAKPGRLLVAVGVGHLIGADSLPGMLRARGLKVERIE